MKRTDAMIYRNYGLSHRGMASMTIFAKNDDIMDIFYRGIGEYYSGGFIVGTCDDHGYQFECSWEIFSDDIADFTDLYKSIKKKN